MHLLACHTIYSARRFPCRTFRARGGVLGCQGTSKSAFPRGLTLHPEVRFAWSWVGYLKPKAERLWRAVAPFTQSLPKIYSCVVTWSFICYGEKRVGGGVHPAPLDLRYWWSWRAMMAQWGSTFATQYRCFFEGAFQPGGRELPHKSWMCISGVRVSHGSSAR